MILYHGTTYNAWKSIVDSQAIKKATPNISPYSEDRNHPTQYGYVYLVANIIEATEYASWAWSAKVEGGHLSARLLVVIKVDIPEQELETDPVDSKSRPMTYGIGSYYRIIRDIRFDEIKAIAAFQYKDFQASCDDIDSWITNEDKLKSILWTNPIAFPEKWNGTARYM